MRPPSETYIPVRKEPEPTTRRIAILFSGQGNRPEDVVSTYSVVRSRFPMLVDIHLGLAQQAINEVYKPGEIDLGEMLTNSESPLYGNTAAVQMTTHVLNLSTSDIVRDRIGMPVATAGHSIGEVAGLVLADVLSRKESYRLVAHRGRFMDEVCKQRESGHVRVQGLSPEVVQQIVASIVDRGEFFPTIALRNAPDLYQVAILESQRAKVEAALAQGGGKTGNDQTAGAFHSAIMEPARHKFDRYLGQKDFMRFRDPEITVISNNTGRESYHGIELVSNHVRGISSTVRWDSSIARLKALGVDQYVVCGPGGRSLPVLNRLNGVPRDQTQTFDVFVK